MCGRMKWVLYFVLMMTLAGLTLEAQAQSLTSFYVASSNRVYYFYIKGSHVFEASPGYSAEDLTAAASHGTPASGPALTGFYRDATYPGHVFFEDNNGHVHELWSDSTAAWHDSDLTASAGGTPARAGSPLTSFYRDAAYPEHVFSEDGNGHIHELWSDSNAAWHDSDLTASASGTVAVAGTSLTSFYWEETYPEHVFFQDGNGHIHELWSDSTAAWHDHDLTQVTGSGAQTYPGNGLTSFHENGNNPEHVIYQNGTLATNPNGGGTIHEMWLDSTNTWHDQNLTALTNAPLKDTITGISGFSTNDSNPEHAFYVDDQGSVHEMWFSSSNATWHDDIVWHGSLSGLYALPILTALSAGSSSSESVFFYQEYYPTTTLSLGGAYDSGGWSPYVDLSPY
jgi:hypothetical protein